MKHISNERRTPNQEKNQGEERSDPIKWSTAIIITSESMTGGTKGGSLEWGKMGEMPTASCTEGVTKPYKTGGAMNPEAWYGGEGALASGGGRKKGEKDGGVVSARGPQGQTD